MSLINPLDALRCEQALDNCDAASILALLSAGKLNAADPQWLSEVFDASFEQDIPQVGLAMWQAGLIGNTPEKDAILRAVETGDQAFFDVFTAGVNAELLEWAYQVSRGGYSDEVEAVGRSANERALVLREREILNGETRAGGAKAKGSAI